MEHFTGNSIAQVTCCDHGVAPKSVHPPIDRSHVLSFHSECVWELPVVSAAVAADGEISVELGATARSGASLSATLKAVNSTEALAADVSPLDADSTTITVSSTLDAYDELKVFTRHSHPLQAAGAVECITAELQQVGHCTRCVLPH